MIVKKIIFCCITILYVGCSTKDKQSNTHISTIKKAELKKLTKTISLIQKYYIKQVDIGKLIDLNMKYTTKEEVNSAIKKIMDKLDKHSVYINSDVYNNYIKIKPFYYKTIDNNNLYIKIPYFTKNTVNNLTQTIQKRDEKIKSIILDLRDNPGGLLNQGIRTVDLFVDKGIIVSKRGRDIHNVTKYKATKKGTITSLPIVVLVNKQSASSAEIVSGALQDLKRATIIGEKTYGKGTIQALIYITKNKKEAINLTVAKYYLPSGRMIENGIIPDLEVLDKQLNYAVKFLALQRGY